MSHLRRDEPNYAALVLSALWLILFLALPQCESDLSRIVKGVSGLTASLGASELSDTLKTVNQALNGFNAVSTVPVLVILLILDILTLIASIWLIREMQLIFAGLTCGMNLVLMLLHITRGVGPVLCLLCSIGVIVTVILLDNRVWFAPRSRPGSGSDSFDDGFNSW